MKIVKLEELKENKWYLLYNKISDIAHKEFVILKLYEISDTGYRFETSVSRVTSHILRSNQLTDVHNQTAYISKSRSFTGLIIYEMSEDDIALQVVSEAIWKL